MAQLTVRNLDDAVVAALKARAKRAGRSAESEHRRILEDALRPEPVDDFLRELYARRVTLPPGSPTMTDLIREDRDRDHQPEDGDAP